MRPARISRACGVGCTLERLFVQTPITLVEDTEDLIRRVSADATRGDGKLTSTAFNDPNCQPSVDRRTMRASLDDCKVKSTDGLVKLVAEDVRKLQIPQIDPATSKPAGTNYLIDVMHRPIDPGNSRGDPPNPAHSQIEATPTLNRSRFDKLKEKLARLAEKHGWLIKPT
jgi:hypothetical protein